MATVTGYTAERMAAIEAASVVDGDVIGGRLILSTFGGDRIDAGNVEGAPGATGLTPILSGSSITSNTLGTGARSFDISPSMNVAFPVGSMVRAVSTVRATDYMVGVVTASTISRITMTVVEFGGTGTLASWVLSIGALGGISQAQALYLMVGSDVLTNLGAMSGAVDFGRALTTAGITNDSLVGAYFISALTGNIVITGSQFPRPRQGTHFHWLIQQDGVGGRTISCRDFFLQNGSIVLGGTAAGANSLLRFTWLGVRWWINNLGRFDYTA